MPPAIQKMLSPETPFRFSILQFLLICGAMVSATATVLHFVENVRHDVESARTEIGALSKTIAEMNEHQKGQDVALQLRLNDWNPWRWRVNADLNTLGKYTGAPLMTKEGTQ